MILSEYTMRRETPGCEKTSVTRIAFSAGNRTLGSEIARKEWFEGEMRGWNYRERMTATREFERPSDAVAWIDELHNHDHVDAVQGLGGTQAIAIA